MNLKLLTIILPLSTLWLAACTKSIAPAEPAFLTKHIGQPCVVEFRRDALGAGAALPISPTTDGINGADVVQVGKLVAVEGEGIAIEESTSPMKTYWIPYHAILSVKFTKQN